VLLALTDVELPEVPDAVGLAALAAGAAEAFALVEAGPLEQPVSTRHAQAAAVMSDTAQGVDRSCDNVVPSLMDAAGRCVARQQGNGRSALHLRVP
jgi:hypothetical protein